MWIFLKVISRSSSPLKLWRAAVEVAGCFARKSRFHGTKPVFNEVPGEGHQNVSVSLTHLGAALALAALGTVFYRKLNLLKFVWGVGVGVVQVCVGQGMWMWGRGRGRGLLDQKLFSNWTRSPTPDPSMRFNLMQFSSIMWCNPLVRMTGLDSWLESQVTQVSSRA